LRFNTFHEPGEGSYWKAFKGGKEKTAGRTPSASSSAAAAAEEEQAAYGGRSGLEKNPTMPRAPAFAMGGRIKERVPTPPPGPREGGSEPYLYRSIGKQVSSEMKDPLTVAFTRAGAAGTTMTIAEQIALLTPTSTTYTPKVDFTKERVRAYPWKKGDGGEAKIDLSGVIGPGAYEQPSMLGPSMFDSTRRSTDLAATPWGKSQVWTGRLPRELEPIKEKYGKAAAIPPPPPLRSLHPDP
jgi:hypothetical protein